MSTEIGSTQSGYFMAMPDFLAMPRLLLQPDPSPHRYGAFYALKGAIGRRVYPISPRQAIGREITHAIQMANIRPFRGLAKCVKNKESFLHILKENHHSSTTSPKFINSKVRRVIA